MILRPYQREALDAVVAARRRGIRRQLVCLPTGTGKTVIFAELASRATHPVLVLAHRAELLEQARDKIQAALGDAGTVAIEQGDRRAPPDARVVVASIRTLHEGRIGSVLAGRGIHLVIYDECHHAAADDNKRVLEQIGAFEDDWPGTLLGVTATTERGDGLGLDTVFEEIVYQRGLAEMITDGFLSPLRGYRIASAADLSHLAGGAGDFDADDLAEAVDIETRNGLVARAILELARGRRTLVFCVNVRHARHLATTLNHVGVPTAMVHGQMPPDARRDTLAAFRAGRFAAVTNVGVLTEGFDDPEVSAIAMARPTRSPSLYQQCVGRGTRLFEGKRDCLILDFVDLGDLSLVTLASLFGMPHQVDLAGEDAAAGAATWQQLDLDLGTGILEAQSLTLQEIQERTEAFDPLTLEVDPEVVAISDNAWTSLGPRGLALHWRRRHRTACFVVLDGGGRGKRYQILDAADQRVVARFSRIEDAVEAVDYEISRMGPGVAASAKPSASWRFEAVSPPTAAALQAASAKGRPQTEGEAQRVLTWHAYRRAPKTR